jgi:uncharacterized protein YfbU (UPF0304 family)
MNDYVYTERDITRGKELVDLVFELTGGEGFIAGGFARYCVSMRHEPVSPGDIDVFCGDEDAFDRIVARFRTHPKMVRKSATLIETKYEYRLQSGYHRNGYSIQLVKPTKILNMVSDGDYRRVLDNFDFTIAKCAVLPTGKALVHNDFDEHEGSNQLVITNIHCPISSAKRVIKYTRRGYDIQSKELLKLFDDFENRSPEWKDLVRRGLDEDALALMDHEERQQFVQTMYLD